MAFLISIAQGILTYTTWQVSARGTIFSLLPLFVYLLLKTQRSGIKFGALVFIIFTLQAATHHYFYFTIPVIASFIGAITLYRLRRTDFFSKIKFPEWIVGGLWVTLLIGAFLVPFFTGLFISGSRYEAVRMILENSIRYTGPLLPIAMAGIIYLILKPNKEFGWLFLLLFFVFFSPFMYVKTYYPYFGVLLLCPLIGVGLVNICRTGRDKKRALLVIVLCIIIFTGFSASYQHSRTYLRGEPVHVWYLEDTTYSGGEWIGTNIGVNERLVSNDFFIAIRTLSVSEVPTLTIAEADATYGFVNKSEINITKNSPLSTEFYSDNPYVITPNTPTSEFYQYYLQSFEYDSRVGKEIIQKLNLSFVIESEYVPDNAFISSLHRGKSCMYDNGRIRVWSLGEV